VSGEAAPLDPEGTARGRGGSTVLVVEDEPDLVWLLRFNLETEGYRTFVARNGKAALELIRRERPDVMLLDLMMPVMDGWALLDELETMDGPRPRVIVVSARTGQNDRARAARYGVEGFVPKPFDMDDLLGLIRRVLPTPPG
jgi:DNA-binding response OmpR family regulator